MGCILMYSNCSQDAHTMRQNFIDVLVSDLNAYRKLFPADIKCYLSRIVGRDIK